MSAPEDHPDRESTTPRVSVLMSVYNAQRYVAESLDSVLNQTLGDFEVLLYDDGSGDATPGILRDYAGRDGRIDLRLRPRGNFVELFNDGIATARGRYVARADGDDLNEPERLARQVAFLDDNPDVVAVGSRVREIDPYGVEIAVSGDRDQPLGHDAIDAALLAGNGWAMSHPAATMRLDALRRVGGYRPAFKFVEDVDLFLRLAEIGQLANLPEPLVRYRRHAKSVSRTNAAAQRRLYGEVVREACARRGLPPPGEISGGIADGQLPADELIERWGWNALRRRNLSVARRHAGQRVRMRPMSWRSWKLALCAARGW